LTSPSPRSTNSRTIPWISDLRFLLDTNILSTLLREPRGGIGEANVCTSIVVAAELRYGVAKSGSARWAATLEAVLGVLPVLPLEPPADAVYGALRAELERDGQLIGPNDLLIAAQTLALGSVLVTDNPREFARVLVTDNPREFARVPRLAIENWRR